MIFVTLNILHDRVVRSLSGGDQPADSPHDKDFVIEEIRDGMNEDLKLEVLQKRAGDGDDKSHIGQMIATYNDLEVKVDDVAKRIYIDLPNNILSLKRNKGIVYVGLSDGLVNHVRVDNPTVTRNLPHGNFETIGNFGYYIEGLRIYWMRDIKKEKITKIMLKVVIAAPYKLGWDDPLPLLPENVGRILDRVKARLQNRMPQDRIADNNPNLRSTNESRK